MFFTWFIFESAMLFLWFKHCFILFLDYFCYIWVATPPVSRRKLRLSARRRLPKRAPFPTSSNPSWTWWRGRVRSTTRCSTTTPGRFPVPRHCSASLTACTPSRWCWDYPMGSTTYRSLPTATTSPSCSSTRHTSTPGARTTTLHSQTPW